MDDVFIKHLPFMAELPGNSGPDEIPNPVADIFRDAKFSLGPVRTLEEKKSGSDWDETLPRPVAKTVNVDGQPLEKAYDSLRMSTRKIALTGFIKRQLAVGETISSLAEYAERHDRETADMIRSIGRELAA